MNCPNCGSENQAGDAFCVDCGQPLAGAPASTPPASAPPASAPPTTASPSNAPPARPARRRWPWLLVVLLLLVLAGAGLVWYLGLLPAAFPSFPGVPGAQPQDKPIVRTSDPFLILQAYHGDELEVFAADLAGDTLATLGVAADQTMLTLAVVDRDYAPWPRPSAQVTSGAAGWAWPDGRAIIVMRSPAGWDLLHYDASHGEIRELMAGAEYLNVSGWTDVQPVLVSYGLEGEQGLLAADAEGNEAVNLISGDAPVSEIVLSPDGQQAVYRDDDLFIASTDGRRINRQRGEFQSAVFSPDGRHLYYTSGRQLIHADSDGRNAQIIAEVGRDDQLWPVSASDSYVAVQQLMGGGHDLRVMTPKGKVLSRAGRSDSAYLAHYLPKDDGLLLAFRGRDGWQIDLADVKGEERRTLAAGLQNFWAAPLRDDRHLALAGQQDGRWSLALHDLRRDDQQALARDLSQLWPLAANAEYIVYAAEDERGWSLQATRLKDGETITLDSGAELGYPDAFFLPEGRELVYEAAQGLGVEETPQPDGTIVSQHILLGGIYRVDLENPAPVTVYDNANLLAASLVR